MEWSLDQLRQFVATAECGSISAAARKLGKVQSAVSAAISLLEIDLGVTLFDRSHRSAKLTEEGRLLRLEAVEVLRQAEELGKRAQFMAGGNDARLVIAMDEALPRTAISTLLRELAQQFPETELTLLNGTAAEMMDFVDQERAGLAFHFDRGSLRTCFEERHMGAVPQGIFAVAGHPLFKQSSVRRRDLVRYRQLIMQADDFNVPTYSPNVWRSDSFHSIAEMVADGLGWAILPVSIAAVPQSTKPLREVICPSVALPLLSVRMIWCQGRSLSRAERWIASRFVELLRPVGSRKYADASGM